MVQACSRPSSASLVRDPISDGVECLLTQGIVFFLGMPHKLGKRSTTERHTELCLSPVSFLPCLPPHWVL